MKKQTGIKTAQKTAPKTAPVANMKARPDKQKQKQKSMTLALTFLLVFILFAAVAIPVSYVPGLKDIAHKFGLPDSITRKLTLIDLALSSLGVETSATKDAFKQSEIIDSPENPLLYASYEPEISHLIDARKTYYYEYEKTRRRPDEISGIYQDGKDVAVPDLKQGQVGGVRSLPNEDYLNDDYNPSDEEYEGGKAGSSRTRRSLEKGSRGSSFRGESYTVDDSFGNTSEKRKKRSSFDKGAGGSGDPAMPGFVSSVYADNPSPKNNKKDEDPATTETVDLNNSRMIKPVVNNPSFGVVKRETPIEEFVGNNDLTKNLNDWRSMGGNEVLGYYVADDVTENVGRSILNKFGTSGKDMLNAYFYSHASLGRKYIESVKYLTELAFSGGKVDNEEILVAYGQKDRKIPSVPEGISPITLMLKFQQNVKECNEAYDRYIELTKEKRRQYIAKQDELKEILNSPDTPAGVPGSCSSSVDLFWGSVHIITISEESPTIAKRNSWNNAVNTLSTLCDELQSAEREYANACNLDYNISGENDTCDSINALRLKPGGTQVWYLHNFWESFTDFMIALSTFGIGGSFNWNAVPCSGWVEWEDFSGHSSFDSSSCRNNGNNNTPTPAICENAIDNLFKNIDENISLTAQTDFVPS